MEARGQRKVKEGVVVKNAANKTIVVNIERHEMHSLYNRVVRRTKHFMAHDENNECKTGDMVQIMETRPLSKLKRWRLVKVTRKAQ
jgi:small subunit ribosomal protein S17